MTLPAGVVSPTANAITTDCPIEVTTSSMMANRVWRAVLERIGRNILTYETVGIYRLITVTAAQLFLNKLFEKQPRRYIGRVFIKTSRYLI
jgi:hypothetical protein